VDGSLGMEHGLTNSPEGSWPHALIALGSMSVHPNRLRVLLLKLVGIVIAISLHPVVAGRELSLDVIEDRRFFAVSTVGKDPEFDALSDVWALVGS
jgi:hypothetical protein